MENAEVKTLLVTASIFEAEMVTAKWLQPLTAPWEPAQDAWFRTEEGEGEIVFGVTGIGSVAAERGIRNLLDHFPAVTSVIGFGVAGGLDPLLKSGDIAVPRTILHLNTTFRPDERLRSELLGSLVNHSETLLTTEQAIGRPSEKAGLFAATNVQTVDMESAYWGQVCEERRIRWAILRVVLDTAGEELPATLVEAVDTFGRPRWSLPIIWRWLSNPRDLRGSIAIGRRAHGEIAPKLSQAISSWRSRRRSGEKRVA